MKEDNGNQNVGATAFDYPSNVYPSNYNTKIFYGNQSVPHPTNESAKHCDASKIMSQVLRGR